MLVLLIAGWSCAYAAPTGAVKLPAALKLSIGPVSCGYIKGHWIPGRKLSGGYFYSRTAERANLLAQAKKAKGKKRKSLQKKAKALLVKRVAETPICTGGTSTPTPTPTATPIATATPTAIATLRTISANLYQTEHVLFIIPEPGQVTWPDYDSIYSTSNVNSYVNTLKAQYPADYFHVVVTAKDLSPVRVPNALTYRSIASGIGEDSITGVGVPNICRYTLDGPPTNGAYGVLEHEMGHNWGVFIGSEFGGGHWVPHSNADGQMAENYSVDGYQTVRRITGDPVGGFTWSDNDNLAQNETELFSERDLYLQGLSKTFPALHVLHDPVYNPDHTVSYSSVSTYDQAYLEAHHGLRSPDYRSSEKRFKVGFVYIARDASEILSVYATIERSAAHFVNAEAIDTNSYRFQVPFLVVTRNRASIDGLLSDLDGNHTPTLALSAGQAVATGGTASLTFTAGDVDGAAPTVSCVPASASCQVSGSTVTVTGLTSGAHFFTLKAQDSGGKKTFAHFVVDQP